MNSHLNILVVDDDCRIGQLFRDVLGGIGHQVDIATSGEEGLKTFREKSHDLVFLDMIMPGMDGLATLQALKTANSQVPVVVMTGFSVLGMLENAEKSGALSLLIKPFSINRIQEVIQEVFSGNQPPINLKNSKALLVAEAADGVDRFVSLLGNLGLSVDVCKDMNRLRDTMDRGQHDLILIYASQWDRSTLENLESVRKCTGKTHRVMLIDDHTQPEELSRQVQILFKKHG